LIERKYDDTIEISIVLVSFGIQYLVIPYCSKGVTSIGKPNQTLTIILVCVFFRIVRNRASDNARMGKDDSSPVSEGVTPHGSPNGQGGTYSINAIMGIQGTPPLTDHNGNGAKRKHDEAGNYRHLNYT